MIQPIKTPMTESEKLTKQIEDISEKIEELDWKRTSLLKKLETTSFKPKIRKIHHKLSEICWKLDDLQEKQMGLEIELDEELYN